MKRSVADRFLAFSTKFEGAVTWMYLDKLGLVTIAIGNLIDDSSGLPPAVALALPLMRPDGAPASRAEIAAEWTLVKAHPSAARLGHRVLQPITRLRLTPDGVALVAASKLAEVATTLRGRFPGFDEWPADAQLATLSMAWACGAHFRFPKLAAALNRRDFSTALRECHIDTDGPDRIPGNADDNDGVKPRNEANLILYGNAAMVETSDLDPDELYYPRDSVRDHKITTPPPPPNPDQLEEPTRIVHSLDFAEHRPVPTFDDE